MENYIYVGYVDESTVIPEKGVLYFVLLFAIKATYMHKEPK